MHTYCTLAMVHGLDHGSAGSKASTITLRKPWFKSSAGSKASTITLRKPWFKAVTCDNIDSVIIISQQGSIIVI